MKMHVKSTLFKPLTINCSENFKNFDIKIRSYTSVFFCGTKWTAFCAILTKTTIFFKKYKLLNKIITY